MPHAAPIVANGVRALNEQNTKQKVKQEEYEGDFSPFSRDGEPIRRSLPSFPFTDAAGTVLVLQQLCQHTNLFGSEIETNRRII